MNGIKDIRKIVRADILARVELAGQAGIRFADVVGYSDSTLRRTSSAMIDAAEIYVGRRTRKNLRLFLKCEWARAFAATGGGAVASKFKRNVAGVRLASLARAAWPADAPTHFPHDAAGKPLYKHIIIEQSQPPGTARIPAYGVGADRGFL